MAINMQDQIDLLKSQLAEYQAEIPVNENKVNALLNRISELEYEMAQQQHAQQIREQEIQEKVEADEIKFNVPGVDFTQLPSELIQLIDAIVHADRKRIYLEEAAKTDELTAKHKDELATANNEVANYKSQVDNLQGIISTGKSAIENIARENRELHDQVGSVKIENEDLQKKLANAAAQLEENAKEIERLNSQIEDYQKAKVFGEVKAQQIIDVTPEETSTMQNLVNSITKKYVNVTPIGGNWHEATAEDGTKTVVHASELPSLETQGSPFRNDSETNVTNNQLPVAQTVENVGGSFPIILPPSIPTVEAGGSQGQQPNQPMAQEATVTTSQLEERLAQFASEYGLVKSNVA
ncbi:hypothetical protein [Paenibacillus rigui]|uniref:Uncharacterized protein n=1 Tax=Paenibacillus rigui TaxID=554312 RepID=A0A229UKT4_9BACL|nr:hypothetical protein [Paenibacillus rigui]OXM83981.1 hypothetical protein CF651_22990 [Paenibacillus rigui]